MSVPTFRFVAWSDGRPTVDAQFWRDVDASDRLASRSEANRFLRELCRSRASEDGVSAGQHDVAIRRLHEAALLREILARGYRVFGPDLDGLVRSPPHGGEDFGVPASPDLAAAAG